MSQNAIIARALLRVVLWRILLAELAGLALLLGTFLVTDSLALLSQFARQGCLIAGALIETLIVRVAIRSIREQYEFGMEKLERSCQLILGLILMSAGAAILAGLSGAGLHRGTADAALAATCHAAWLLWAWPALAPRSATRPVALLVQLLLTLAALSPDAGAARLADLAAATAVALLAICQGTGVLYGSLRDLLDYPAGRARVEQALQTLAAGGLDRATLRRVRSREAEDRLFLHLHVAADEAPAALAARLARAKAALDATRQNVDVVFSLA